MTVAVDLVHDGLVGAVVSGQPRQVVEAVVVVGGGRVAPPGLQQAHRVGPHVSPEAGPALVGRDEPVEVLVLVRVRHRDVARQEVEQRRDVGRALDAGVPAQREDATAGPADVAEQGLQDRGGADVLHADAVVGPADGVTECRRALAPAVAGDRVGDLRELRRLDAADVLHHLRGVAGEVPLEDLVDAARVLQRLVPRRLGRDGRAAGAGRLRALGLVGDLLRSAGVRLVGVGPAFGGLGGTLVLPRHRVVGLASPGSSRRRGRRGPRCRGSPRRRSRPRWCRRRRSRGSRVRWSARG